MHLFMKEILLQEQLDKGYKKDRYKQPVFLLYDANRVLKLAIDNRIVV